MIDNRIIPKFDGMEYEELVVAAQFFWMRKEKLEFLCRSMRSALERNCKDVTYLEALDYELESVGIKEEWW